MGQVIYLAAHKKGENVMPTVFDVAHFFLHKQSMDNKKLQKLCYYAQAWFLAFYKSPLFVEKIEAWVHGPVSPSLYSEYKQYRFSLIHKMATLPEIITQNQGIKDHLENVFETYGDFTGDELEALTHLETPWLNARKGLEEWEPSNNEISHQDMTEYYWDVYEKSQAGF